MRPGVGRYSEQLRRLLTIAGVEPMELEELLQGVFVLENDRPEWYFLRGERLCFGRGGATAGGISEKGFLTLINPLGSGVLAVVELIRHFSAANGGVAQELAFLTNLASAPLAGTISTNVGLRDRRGGGSPALVVRQGTATNAEIAAASQLVTFLPSDVSNAAQHAGKNPVTLILPPGQGVITFDAGENENFNAAYDWRERAIGKYESS